jgi:hypothetical protein
VVNVGDVIAVTTFNDTSQQNLLTLVWVGPVITGLTSVEAYDTTEFDVALVSGDPGTFDYAEGTSISSNQFDLERANVNSSRLWVTLDGYRLFDGVDFSVEGNQLILAAGAISPGQVVVLTEMSNSIVPEAIEFRIFQDMRGVQAVYRMTEGTTTYLTQPLSATADIAYVDNAAALSMPVLEDGIFGLVTIGGERIMYRDRDLANNTISGLRRGTAGTGAASHNANAVVYDISRGNLLPEQYQDYIVSNSTLGDGSTTVFYAPDIDIADIGDSSTTFVESIEVYVGGVRQYNYADTTAESQYRWIATDFGPLAIEFVTDTESLAAPAAGVEVTILQRRGTWWYDLATAETRALALQETDTAQARFLRGL